MVTGAVAATNAVMTAAAGAASSSPVDLLVPSTTKFGGDMDHRCSPKVVLLRSKNENSNLLVTILSSSTLN